MDAILEGFEQSSARFGLQYPISRASVAFLLTTAGMFVLQPAFAFTDGAMRPFAPLGGDDPTRFPWWAPGLVTAFVFGALL